jgi:PAS domain S-box-containing protein
MSETLAPNLTTVLELLVDTVFVVDLHGRILMVTPSCVALIGYDSDELIDKHMIEFVHPYDRGRTLQAVWQLANIEPTIRFRNHWVHKFGHPVAIEWVARWSDEHQVRVAVARAVAQEALIAKGAVGSA